LRALQVTATPPLWIWHMIEGRHRAGEGNIELARRVKMVNRHRQLSAHLKECPEHRLPDTLATHEPSPGKSVGDGPMRVATGRALHRY
jgi:hypothetical protein